MATVADVSRIAATLPGVVEARDPKHADDLFWTVGGKWFVRERRFSKADVRRFGDEPVPGDPILALTVEDLEEKRALLAEGLPGVFTIPHFEGFPAVLLHLEAVREADLSRLLMEAWATVAPPDVVRDHLGGR